MTPTSEEYQQIEAMYLAAGNLDKDEFCEKFKMHGDSPLVTELFKRTQVLSGMLEERHNELDDCHEKNCELAYFLIGKACAYDDTDFYKEAVRLIGQRKVTMSKIRMGMPLWDEDRAYIENNLQ